MKRTLAMTALGVVLAQAGTARATLIVSATINSQQLSANSYKYSLTLTNSSTSTDSASSFWFGWFPGYDLLPHAPSSFASPTGWNGVDAPDAFGVASAQWTTSTSSLAPGQTLSGFSFTTSDPPSAIIGVTSPYFGFPVEETYVYSIAPESGSVDAIVPVTVPTPEPSSILMLLGAPLLLLLRRRRRLAHNIA